MLLTATSSLGEMWAISHCRTTSVQHETNTRLPNSQNRYLAFQSPGQPNGDFFIRRQARALHVTGTSTRYITHLLAVAAIVPEYGGDEGLPIEALSPNMGLRPVFLVGGSPES